MCLNPRWQCLNPRWQNIRWQNSRWLPSSTWVRMNEGFFWWKWLKPKWQNSRWLLSSSWMRMKEWSFFGKMDESNMTEFKLAAIIKLSENEWVWVRLNEFESESEWSESVFWVNLREDNNMSESKMTLSESFKMNAVIKLSQNEWVKDFVQMVGTNLGKCEWLWEEILRWLNPRWPNSRWLPSSS